MKAKYKFYVTDWNPSGLNDVLVYRGNRQINVLTEVLFGVDVNKLNSKPVYLTAADEFYGEPVWRIPKTIIRKHVACGPFDGPGGGGWFDNNCKALSKYLRGGK